MLQFIGETDMMFLVMVLVVVGGVYGGINGLGTQDTQPIHEDVWDQTSE